MLKMYINLTFSVEIFRLNASGNTRGKKRNPNHHALQNDTYLMMELYKPGAISRIVSKPTQTFF